MFAELCGWSSNDIALPTVGCGMGVKGTHREQCLAFLRRMIAIRQCFVYNKCQYQKYLGDMNGYLFTLIN